MDMLGQALGKAIDWAIVYGTGSKMPVGYMTRLAAQSEPACGAATRETLRTCTPPIS